MKKLSGFLGLTCCFVGLVGTSVFAQATPNMFLEVSAINGQVLKSMACTTNADCPGNSTCQGVLCTNATALDEANGDIAAGDSVIVEAYVEGWDPALDQGTCQNGDVCNVPAQNCIKKHCTLDANFECTFDGECFTHVGVVNACIPDTCTAGPLVNIVQWKVDGASLASGQNGSFEPTQIACDAVLECDLTTIGVTTCPCTHGTTNAGQCTCYKPGICDAGTGFCTNEAIGYFESGRPDIILAGLASQRAVAFPASGYEYLSFVNSQQPIGEADPQTPRYIGSIDLTATPDINGLNGTFTIGIDGDPASTFMAEPNLASLPSPTLVPVTINFAPDCCIGFTCPPSGDCKIDTCQCVGGSPVCSVQNEPAGTACTDDGDLCTNDRCNPIGSCIHPPITCFTPGDVCCPIDGVCKQPAQCGCTMVLSTDPPNCEVDAGQPHPIGDNTSPQGWMSIDFDFDGACVPANTTNDFSIRTVPGGAPPPAITGVVNNLATTTVNFGGVIPTNEWTCVTHTTLGVEKCIGFLPADVNASLGSNAQDITALINSLNGVVPRPIFATDVNRSGPPANPQDITGLINLLNGAGAFIPWNGQVISTQCPS